MLKSRLCRCSFNHIIIKVIIRIGLNEKSVGSFQVLCSCSFLRIESKRFLLLLITMSSTQLQSYNNSSLGDQRVVIFLQLGCMACLCSVVRVLCLFIHKLLQAAVWFGSHVPFSKVFLVAIDFREKVKYFSAHEQWSSACFLCS